MAHLTTERILAYLAEEFSGEELFQIDNHLAECSQCAEQVRQYFILREQFDEVWDSWTAWQHARELVAERVRRALTQTEAAPGLDERLKNWLRQLADRTQLAVEVSLQAARQAAHVMQERLETFCRPGLLPLTPVPTPARAHGVQPPGVLETAPIRLKTAGPHRLEIIVDAANKKVTVLTAYGQEPWPLAALIPKIQGPARVTQSRHPEGTDYLLAEFEDIPDGDYFIFLESAPSNV